MKGIKPIYTASIAVLTLAGCASVKNIPVPEPMNNAVDISTKSVALTDDQMKSWSHMDLATDTVPGMSMVKAYEFLADKEGEQIIVGVIDSGIDVEHEDLAANTWVNPKEVAGNGIDDDKNGYIDDIKGWNFIGGSDGNVYAEQLEITRIVKKGIARFGTMTESEVAEADLADYKEFQKIKAEFDENAAGGKQTLERMDFLLGSFQAAEIQLGKSEFEVSDWSVSI